MASCGVKLAYNGVVIVFQTDKPELDFAAAGRIVTVGSTLYAPTLYFWYEFLI